MSSRLDTSHTRQQVADLYDKGLSVRDIAHVVGVSTQRVYQHLKALELPAPSARNA